MDEPFYLSDFELADLLAAVSLAPGAAVHC